MKILLLSDTHGQLDETRNVIGAYRNMDAYIHLGDVGFELKELHQFDVVRGNHDHMDSLPYKMIKMFGKHRVACLHGNLFDNEVLVHMMDKAFDDKEDIMEACMNMLYDLLSNYAKTLDCDVLLFGHTHHQVCTEVHGVTLINPDSLCFGSPHSGYAIVDIQDEKIDVKFHESKGMQMDS